MDKTQARTHFAHVLKLLQAHKVDVEDWQEDGVALSVVALDGSVWVLGPLYSPSCTLSHYKPQEGQYRRQEDLLEEYPAPMREATE